MSKNIPPEEYRTAPARLTALGALVGLGWLSMMPSVSEEARGELAAGFAFERSALPLVTAHDGRDVLAVHPELEHISAWVSAVGSGMALADIDGDGLSNDMCISEPRTGSVILAPAPSTPERFAPFELSQAPHFDGRGSSTGCLVGDFNEDGYADLVVTYFGHTPQLFLRQLGSDGPGPLSAAAFTAQPLIPGSDARWYTATALLADIDADGHVDLFIGNYFIEESNLYDPTGTNTVELQDSFSHALNGGRNHVFLWTAATSGASPSATFAEAEDAFTEEEARGWTLAAGAADLDKDGKVDLYIANDYGPDGVFHNQSEPGRVSLERIYGARDATTPPSRVMGRDSFKGMGVDFGDLNGDGFFDIFVSNIAAEWALQESHYVWVSTGEVAGMADGRAPYIDRGEELGMAHSDWGWGTRFGDFDNDGVLEAIQATGFRKGEINKWPELAEFAIGNDLLVHRPQVWPRVRPGDDISGHEPNPFYVRDASGRYWDVSAELGIDQGDASRGIVTGDVDGDGDLDWAVTSQWDASWFFRNDAPDPGNYLGLHLLRTPGDLSETVARTGHPTLGEGWPAFGAVATARLPDGSVRVGHVDGGSGHTGARSPEIHIGLGDLSDDSEIEVELIWRDGAGTLRKETINLNPGWHTVALASESRR
ncbi:MAG: hypothetical protein ACI8S6_000437 [Myxococcota bacterium]